MEVLAASVLLLASLALKWRRSGQRLIDFLGLSLVYLYARLWHGCRLYGLAHLPGKGPAILVANHTCSADPALLTAGCSRVVSFIVAGEYYNSGLLRWLFDRMRCVPAWRRGRDVAATRAALRRLAEGCIVGVFPEGGLSNVGRRRFRPGKVGAAFLALKSKAPVYPALITGGPQTSSVRRAWLCPSHARVTFGPAVDLSAYYDRPIRRKLLAEVAQVLMSRVAALPGATTQCPEGRKKVLLSKRTACKPSAW